MRQPVNLTYAHIHTQTHAGKPLTAAACCCCCCVGTRASYIQNVMHWGWAFFFFIRPSIRSRFKWIHAAARCCFKWNEWTVKREKNESTATTGVSTEQPVCAGYILTAHINYYFLYGGIKLEKKSPMWRANTVKQISVDLAVCPSTFESHDDILVSPQRTNEKKMRWFKRIFNFSNKINPAQTSTRFSFAFCFNGLKGVKISKCKKCGCVRYFAVVSHSRKMRRTIVENADYSIETIKPIKVSICHFVQATSEWQKKILPSAWKTMRQRRAQRDDIY